MQDLSSPTRDFKLTTPTLEGNVLTIGKVTSGGPQMEIFKFSFGQNIFKGIQINDV